MRKLWIPLIVVIALGVVAAVFSLGKSKPDGLEFIRKYGPQREFISDLTDFTRTPSGVPKPITVWDRVFAFDQVPTELAADLESRGSRVMSAATGKLEDVILFQLPNQRAGLFYTKKNMIVIAGGSSPSWLDKQWYALRKQMGADFTTPRSAKK